MCRVVSEGEREGSKGQRIASRRHVSGRNVTHKEKRGKRGEEGTHNEGSFLGGEANNDAGGGGKFERLILGGKGKAEDGGVVVDSLDLLELEGREL